MKKSKTNPVGLSDMDLSRHSAWREAKRDLGPSVLVLCRVGQFWETFDDDALRLARAVGLAVRVTNGIRLAGFPEHHRQAYFGKLAAEGISVATAEEAAPFELAHESATRIKRVTYENTPTHQTMLLSGLDLLPGQLNLFATDGERDGTTWPADAPDAGG